MNEDVPDNSPPAYESPPQYHDPPGTEPNLWQRFKKFLAPAGVVLVLGVKFFGKVKFLILPLLKFLPVILKTGGTMVLSIGLYALQWGVWFALGFVVLIFVHECGHLLAARRIGLKVGAPVFIPFMGAVIALKEAPRNAWIEAQVGIGGPVLGTLGAAMCEGIFQLTGNLLFRALAHTGFLLNLFNLAPIGFLDGGRVVTALSPWLWLVGAGVMGIMLLNYPNFLLLLVLLFSLPRLFSLFRHKTEAERRYFEVTPAQRWFMAALYFGLVACLVWGMEATYVAPRAGRGM
jgi:Zn-dependent protease